MTRAAQERPHTVYTWKSHLKLAHPRGVDGCLCELQPGRFRKGQRRLGCGNARCYMCHAEKLFKIPTSQQKAADLRLAEGLAEL